MRRMLMTTLAVLLFALGVCAFSMMSICRTTEHLRHLRSEAILHMEAGDIQAVEETLAEMANYLAENEGWMTVFCNHDDLHAIKGEIIDAQASVEFGIEDDFYQAIARFGEGIEHIASEEEISLSNLC